MGPPTPRESDIKTLTEPIKTGEVIRAVRFEECWNWALENWDRVVPEAKEPFLEWAGRFNEKFAEAVTKIEEESKLGQERGPRKGRELL